MLKIETIFGVHNVPLKVIMQNLVFSDYDMKLI